MRLELSGGNIFQTLVAFHFQALLVSCDAGQLRRLDILPKSNSRLELVVRDGRDECDKSNNDAQGGEISR